MGEENKIKGGDEQHNEGSLRCGGGSGPTSDWAGDSAHPHPRHPGMRQGEPCRAPGHILPLRGTVVIEKFT